jgi:DNA-binding MarR family transcriptional regulator
MTDAAPRRLTLLYQLFLAHQTTRQFMRLALAGSGMSGEEYALYSYLYANGARSLSQAARDLGWPITTLSTMLQPLIDAGQLQRTPHPRDGRSRLLSLTDEGRTRLEGAMPGFTAGYRALLRQLEDDGVDAERVYRALASLMDSVQRTNELLAGESVTTGSKRAGGVGPEGADVGVERP